MARLSGSATTVPTVTVITPGYGGKGPQGGLYWGWAVEMGVKKMERFKKVEKRLIERVEVRGVTFRAGGGL